MYAASLEKKNQELKLKNQELESFGYIASHDLQEPVRKIQIWANKLEETEDISDNLRDSLSRIQKACVKMQNLIKGILQYSQTDQQHLPQELTDLNLIMEEVIEGFSDTIEEKQIIIDDGDHLPQLSVVRTSVFAIIFKYDFQRHPVQPGKRSPENKNQLSSRKGKRGCEGE